MDSIDHCYHKIEEDFGREIVIGCTAANPEDRMSWEEVIKKLQTEIKIVKELIKEQQEQQ